jgi:pyruvate formate lyase activating enzyme
MGSEGMKSPAPTGIIFNIQRFSIHDGPGIRTTVFLKGCSLRCFWCHNPEGLHLKPEIQFFSTRCIGCGECVTTCQEGAQLILADGTRVFDREKCTVCGDCVENCFPGGLQINGKTMTVDEVLDEVRQDRSFYETSGGGVTLSGGEPMLQPDFAYNLLAKARDEGIPTAIETTTNVRWDLIERMLPVTDLFMVDIKSMDSAKHKAATGVPNEQILENIRRLAARVPEIIFRVPVVPTVNDTREDIAAIAQFVAELKALRPAKTHTKQLSENHPIENPDLELLPFHRMAGDKYTSLEMDYQAVTLDTPSKEKMTELADVAKQFGITVRCR